MSLATEDDVSVARFQAAPGEVNVVTISASTGLVVRFRDDGGAPVTAGAGCTQLAPAEVECPKPPESETLDALVDAGDGDDVVRGSPGSDDIRGGPGADRLEGGAGADDIVPGDAAAADVVDGGPGRDFADYRERTDPLLIDLEEGRSAEDFVKLVESVRGGRGDDVIFGSLAADALGGGRGNDELHGRDGGDDLFGGPGDDRLEGSDGDDELYGESGTDRLDAGPGNDHLYGMHDDNRSWPLAQVGANTHACGAGIDRVHHVRRREFVNDDCEVAGLQGDDPLFTLPPVRRASDPVLIVRDVPLGGRASLRLFAGSRRVASVGLGPRRRNVPVRLSRAGQRILRGRRRINVRLHWRGVRRTGGFTFAVDV